VTLSPLEKGEAFRALHESEPFVIPNPWDAGSAKALAKLGFQALASTSGGFAQTLGRSDGEVSLDEAVDHAPGTKARSVSGPTRRARADLRIDGSYVH
jgi:2-methylisocitrate lyase-like PEP mutase family enzyme